MSDTEYKREELIALMREMEKQIALCHISSRLAGALADELERSEPVVRCKDCKHRVERGMCYMISGCPELVGVGDNFWCAYGERKDGDG